jgi:aspartate aminotransferase-like enzyme
VLEEGLRVEEIVREQPQRLVMLPGPTNVPAQVLRAMLRPTINHRGSEFQALYRRIVENAKYVFETRNDLFVLTSSGTGGVECAVSNVTAPGDKVLVLVNGAFSGRAKDAVKAYGGSVVELEVEWGKAPTIDQVKAVLDKEKGIKTILTVYNETSTGATTKCLPEIGELCRERNILLVVDAISILGGSELPVDRWGIDICVTGSQKCLMSPAGLALISVSDRAWVKIQEMKQRRYYFDLQCYREFQKQNALPTTPSLPLFYALDEALQLIRQEGLESVFQRHESCSNAMYSAVEAMGLTPFAAQEFRSRTVAAIRYPPNVNGKEFRDLLLNKYNIIVAGGLGKLKDVTFRIGIMGKVGPPEVLQTVSALENALTDLHHPLRRGSGSETANRLLAR